MTTVTTDMISGTRSSLAWKAPVRLASTANIASMSGLLTVDGVVTAAADRVLVKDQSTASENGIWIAATGAWARAGDWDGANDIATGTQVYVTAGTVNAGRVFVVTTTGTITIGTTSVTLDILAGLSVGQSSGALYDTFLSKSANYTVVAADEGAMILVDATGGAVTITLPGISGVGDFKIGVAKMDASANAVTVARAGGDTLNGGTTIAIATQYENLGFLAKSGTTEWVAAGYAGTGRYKVAGTWTATQAFSGAALNLAYGANIAAATTTDIGAATGNTVTITGSAITITGLGTVQAGTRRTMYFAGANTLTHNATSLILPGGADIDTAAGDVAECVSLGSGNWLVCVYTKADGTAVVADTPGEILVGTVTSTGATMIVDSIPANIVNLRVEYDIAPANSGVNVALTFRKSSGTDITARQWDGIDITGGIVTGTTAQNSDPKLNGTTNVVNTANSGRVAGSMRIFNIQSAAYKGFTWHSTLNGTPVNYIGGGQTADTGTITGIKIAASSGNVSGRMSVYGSTS